MATVFKGAFTALFVETPDYQVMSEEDVKRLRNNMHLAEPVSYTHLDVYKRQVQANRFKHTISIQNLWR